MEFLKNHYEKIILSLVLIGLAGAAGWLALQSMSFRSVIQGVNNMAPVPKKPDMTDQTNVFFVALTNAMAPQEVDFDGEHKIFNPEKILRQVGTTTLIPQNKIGPKNLQIQNIRPMRLMLRAEPRLFGGKPRLYIQYLAEFETGTYANRWGKVNAAEGRTARLTSPVARNKRIALVVNRVAGDLLKPESLEIDLDLVVGAGLPEPVTLKGTNTWEKEFEFEADLYYPPEQRNYTGVRLYTPLVFGGDTNTVIQITRDEVTLRAASNGKRTTLSWSKQKAAAAAAQAAASAAQAAAAKAMPGEADGAMNAEGGAAPAKGPGAAPAPGQATGPPGASGPPDAAKKAAPAP